MMTTSDCRKRSLCALHVLIHAIYTSLRINLNLVNRKKRQAFFKDTAASIFLWPWQFSNSVGWKS